MDTSETYIKMRLAAIPDLGMGKPPDARSDYWHTDEVFTDAIGNWYYSTVDKTVQLERQDQLQEMCNPREYAGWLNTDFQQWIVNEAFKVGNPGNPHSMEQLWFSFVMKELYSKSWTGEEWKPTLTHV